MRSEAQEAAYAEFVTARHDDLRRVALALTTDRHRAEEVLDRALVRLYVAWPRLEREGTEEDVVRRLLVRADLDAPAGPPPTGPCHPVLDALRSLPPRQRRCLVLVGWLGLSPAEAAEELGLSESAVRAAATRALTAFGARVGSLAETPGAGARPAGGTSSPGLREQVDAALDHAALDDTALDDTAERDGAPGGGPRPVAARLAAGRRALRRRRRTTVLGTAAALALVAAAPLALRQGAGPGGGIDNETPLPLPTSTPVPTPVHLLVAPPRYVRPDTPPVLYLFGRMFKRSRDVTVLATFGEIDTAVHPQGGAIVRIGGRTTWVAVVGNEPHRLVEQRAAPYDYPSFTAWASEVFPVMSGHYALSATAPGPYRPPVPDAASPAEYDGGRLVARPGGEVVQRVMHPVSHTAIRPCAAQAVRVHRAAGDWFVLGQDCGGHVALYSERVGVRATALTSWLLQVKRAQDAYGG